MYSLPPDERAEIGIVTCRIFWTDEQLPYGDIKGNGYLCEDIY